MCYKCVTQGVLLALVVYQMFDVNVVAGSGSEASSGFKWVPFKGVDVI